MWYVQIVKNPCGGLKNVGVTIICGIVYLKTIIVCGYEIQHRHHRRL